MSRIGKNPIPIPSGVTVAVEGNQSVVKGPKGELTRTVHERVSVSVDDGTVTIASNNAEALRNARAWVEQPLTSDRALLDAALARLAAMTSGLARFSPLTWPIFESPQISHLPGSQWYQRSPIR